MFILSGVEGLCPFRHPTRSEGSLFLPERLPESTPTFREVVVIGYE